MENVPAFEEKLTANIKVYSVYDDKGRARYQEYVSKKYKMHIDILHWMYK